MQERDKGTISFKRGFGRTRYNDSNNVDFPYQKMNTW